MDQSVLVTNQEPIIIEKGSSTKQPTYMPLRQSVREFLKQHLMQFDTAFSDFYNLILAEVEAPMLELVLQYADQNQSEAARILAMSRGTLRKKMRCYGLLPRSKRRRQVDTRVI